MKNTKKILKLWLPLLVYMGFMWHLSSGPIEMPSFLRFPFSDKVVHFFEYFLFGYLLARAIYTERWTGPKAKLIITVVLLAFVWGGIDELHQSFVPTRVPSVFDVIADCIGAALGSGSWVSVSKKHG